MKKANVLAAFYGMVGFASTALAQTESGILNPLDKPATASTTNLRQGVANIINYILMFLGLIAVAYIIWAGIKMVTSGGNESKVKEGQKTITYAVVGLLVIFLSYAIVNWVVFAPSATPQ